MRDDRHGRVARADSDRRRRPSAGFRVRDTGRFAQVVTDAVADLPDRLAAPLAGARLSVLDVPAETTDEGRVVLARLHGSVLTVYRRPLEVRADTRGDLHDAVRIAVGEAVAEFLGIDDDLDDLYGD